MKRKLGIRRVDELVAANMERLRPGVERTGGTAGDCTVTILTQEEVKRKPVTVHVTSIERENKPVIVHVQELPSPGPRTVTVHVQKHSVPEPGCSTAAGEVKPGTAGVHRRKYHSKRKGG